MKLKRDRSQPAEQHTAPTAGVESKPDVPRPEAKRKRRGAPSAEAETVPTAPQQDAEWSQPKRRRGRGPRPDATDAPEPGAPTADGPAAPAAAGKRAGRLVRETQAVAEETAAFFQNFEAFYDTHEFVTDAERVECLESAHSHLLTLLDGQQPLLNHKGVAAGVDHLIERSTQYQIRRLLHHMAGSYAQLMMAGGTSRIMELLITATVASHAAAADGDAGPDPTAPPSLTRLLVDVVREIAEDVPTLVGHRFGSFPLRTLLRVLGGVPLPEAKASPAEDLPVFIQDLTTVCERIVSAVSVDVVTSCRDVPTSACLQILIDVLARLESRASDFEASPLFDGLLALYASFRETVLSHFDALIDHPATARLVEALLGRTPPADFCGGWRRHVAPRVPKLLRAPGPTPTFILQASIQAASQVNHLDAVLESLTVESIMTALGAAKFGLLNHLLQAAGRIGHHQAEVVTRLTTALRGYLKKPSGSLVPSMLTHAAFKVGKTHFGHVLLQQVLAQGPVHASAWYSDFADHIVSPDRFQELVVAQSGSRIVEAYLVGADKRTADTVASTLVGRFAALARDPNGSYVLERLFQFGGLDTRTAVVKELAKDYPALRHLPHALMVLKHCEVDQYRGQPQAWEARQARATRKDELLAKMLGAMSRRKFSATTSL